MQTSAIPRTWRSIWMEISVDALDTAPFGMLLGLFAMMLRISYVDLVEHPAESALRETRVSKTVTSTTNKRKRSS
jgi:hypothetical protein